MRFEFSTAGKILFGPGAFQEIPGLVRGLASRLMVVSGQGGASPEKLLSTLGAANFFTCQFLVSGEPTVGLITHGVEQAMAEAVDLVVGFGGGSVIDAGKAIAILRTNPGNLIDYLEVIGKGQSLVYPPLPYIAIPTTAGTGAEVTRNAVITSPEYKVKVSLRSPLMLPKVAVVDPELTYSMPPAVTASTGMDAIAQVLEPFVSIRANALTDGFCRTGMRSASTALRQAYFHGEDAAAREAMALTSLMGGLALANAGLGVVHGFASVIGGMFPAPHGEICARLIGPVMETNLDALRERAPDHPALARYAEAAQILTQDANATPEDGVRWIQELCIDLNIPRLSAFGITPELFGEIIDKTMAASSTKANPIQLTRDELAEILEKSL